MYAEFYGMTEKPFELMPDVSYLYLSDEHRKALDHLTYGVSEHKGFVQLTGEVGTGKTMMLDALLAGLDARTSVVRVSRTTVDEREMLAEIARGLGGEGAWGTKGELLGAIEESVLRLAADGRNAVLVVDEAQNLSLAALEELRLLSNISVGKRSPLQIILAGQSELREKLDSHSLRQLKQRVSIRYELMPLSGPETSGYIRHRLAVAGVRDGRGVFTRGAVEAIYEASGGVPRVINAICDAALLAGYADNRRKIDRQLVLDAAGIVEARSPDADRGALEGPAGRSTRTAGGEALRWVAVAAAVVLLGLTAAYLPRRLAGFDDARGSGRPVLHVTTRAGEAVAETRVSPDPGAGSTTTGARGDAAEGPAGPTEPAAVDSPGTGPYVVVVASGTNREAAYDEASRLTRTGVRVEVWSVDLGERGVWHRVVLRQRFRTPESATEAMALLTTMGHEDTWIAKDADAR